jgi:hypothetical protein
MLIKLLGFTDLLAGLILIFGAKMDIPQVILVFFGIILLIKSFLGGIPKNLGSFTDLFSGGIFFLLIIINIHWIFCLIAGLFLIQKGVVSFL